MSNYLSRHIDMLKNGTNSSEKIFERNILPLENNQMIEELIHWVARITEKFVKQPAEKNLALRLLRIVINIIATTSDFSDELAGSTHDIISQLSKIDAKACKPFAHLKTSNDFNKFAKDFQTKTVEQRDEFLADVSAHASDHFVTVRVRSDPKKAEKNLEKSDKAYNKEMAQIAGFISLKRSLWKAYSKRRDNKFRARTLLKPLCTNYPLDLALPVISQEFKVLEFRKFIFKYNIHIEFFSQVDKVYKQLMKFFSTASFSNPLEFYFISSLLKKTVACGHDYTQTIIKAFNDQELAKDIHKNVIANQKQENLNQITQEYAQWLESRVKQGRKEDKTDTKKKLTRAKWEEEKFMIRMQKIAKKRRGLKKQEMLEYKAMKLKNK